MTLDAERAVIGAALLSSTALDECVNLITADDFTWQRGALLWHVMGQMHAHGKPVDPVTVIDELLEKDLLDKVGGAEEPFKLTSDVPSAANAAYYAGIVADAAARRRIRDAAQRIVQRTEESADVADLAAEAAELLDGAVSRRFTLSTIGDGRFAMVDFLSLPPTYTPTPWANLNDYIDGFRPGGLYVIGARPGAGKTIMGLQSAVALAATGPVAYSSLEMATSDLTTRLYSSLGGIPLTRMMRHDLKPDHWQTIRNLEPRVSKLPLFVDDRSRVTVGMVRAHARQVLSRSGSLKAVVVDYLQLLGHEGRSGANRAELVGEMSRSLKIMARELNVPVIAMSQLNRQTEMGAGRLPTLADLRESGNIEQDADVVVLLQRRAPDPDEPGDWLDVVVAKNRHGRTGQFSLVWEGLYARVLD